MEDIIKVIADNGISVVCVAYMIYFQSVTMRDVVKALGAITERLTVIEAKIEGPREA